MSDTVTVTRSRLIPASASAIYFHLVDFHRWTAWSPWEGIDPNLSRTYSGPDAGVGAHYAWTGNRKVGAGNMTITEAMPNERVALDLNFLKPFKSHNTTVFALEPQGEATLVRWEMVAPKTMMSKIMGIFMSLDKMVGKDFEKGLAQLESAALESSQTDS